MYFAFLFISFFFFYICTDIIYTKTLSQQDPRGNNGQVIDGRSQGWLGINSGIEVDHSWVDIEDTFYWMTFIRTYKASCSMDKKWCSCPHWELSGWWLDTFCLPIELWTNVLNLPLKKVLLPTSSWYLGYIWENWLTTYTDILTGYTGDWQPSLPRLLQGVVL